MNFISIYDLITRDFPMVETISIKLLVAPYHTGHRKFNQQIMAPEKLGVSFPSFGDRKPCVSIMH